MLSSYISRIYQLHLLPAMVSIRIGFLFPAASVAGTIYLNSVTIKSNAPVSGNSSKGTIIAAKLAPAGGVIVALSSSNSKVATVPTSVEIPAGSKTATFTIKTGVVANATTVTITARSANIRSATLTVNPAATVNWKDGPAVAIPVTNQCFAADFNGDGKTDLACYSGSAGSWNVVLSTGSGWKSQFWNGGPSPALPVNNQCFAGDLNADGKTDLACYTGSGSSWEVALSTGAGWRLESWSGGGALSGRCYAGDFNGDRRTDLACYYGNPYGSGNWSVSLSTGTGWDLQPWGNGPAPVYPRPWNCYPGEFNRDGKTDIACYTFDGSGTWNVGLSTGAGWDTQQWSGGPNPSWWFPPFLNCFNADFNGDGLTDLACATSSAGTWELGLSVGTGWNHQFWSAGPTIALPANNQCFSGHFNADRRADLACYAGVGTGWGVGLSTGSSWQGALWNGGPAPSEPVFDQCFTGDFNGDGVTDLACYTGSNGVWSVALSSGHGW